MRLVTVLAFSYRTSRFEVGEEVTGLPDREIRTLIRQGVVKQVGGPKPIMQDEEVGGGDS